MVFVFVSCKDSDLSAINLMKILSRC